MIVIVFTSSFFKRFSHFAFASWQLVFFFIAIIVSISFFYNYAVSLTIYFSVFLVLNFIYYYSLFFASKFVNKLSWLGSNAYYENKHFLYQNFVSSFFYDDIKKKNINYALVAVFKINGLEEILHENGRRTYNEAKKNILTIIYNFFKSEKNISFFITSSGKPGIILTYDNLFNHKLNKSFDGNHLKERNEDDNLFFLERIINSLPNKLSLNGITKEIFINSYCSFYGIYSNDIDQIIDSLDKETSINIYKNNLTYVQLLDQIDNQKGLFDYSSISKLEKEINFLNINISLFETMSYNQNVLIPTFFYKNLLISSLESILKNVSAPSQEILLRNLAARTLNLYSQLKSNNDFKISIYYSLSFLNKNDISNRFLLKINDCSIKSEKIILLLNCNDGCLLNQIFKKNINFLKQNKINIHLYNFGSKDIYLLNFVRPKYVTFSKFILENKILYNHLLLLTKKYNIKIIN